MDLDRTSLGERRPDLRTRQQVRQEPADPQPEQALPVAPKHGGPIAPGPIDKHTKAPPERDTQARRRDAQEAITRFLSTRGNTLLDIQVDTEEDEVTVKIRNKETGKLIRVIPEPETTSLLEALREQHGALVDRSA